jgi:hypothetical protein
MSDNVRKLSLLIALALQRLGSWKATGNGRRRSSSESIPRVNSAAVLSQVSDRFVIRQQCIHTHFN